MDSILPHHKTEEYGEASRSIYFPDVDETKESKKTLPAECFVS